MTQCRLAMLIVWLVGGLTFGPGALADDAGSRIALKGYDVVAYFTDARPMEGDPRFEVRFDGAVYRFSSARHLQLFNTDPDRYLPQYGGICTAALAKGKRVAASPNYWTIHDGRLHVFAEKAVQYHSFDSRGRLIGKKSTNMKAEADKNWAKLSALTPPASSQGSSGKQ